MRSPENYIKILKTKGLLYSLREGFRAIWPLWWTGDRKSKDLINSQRVYCYLKRRYSRYIHDYPEQQAPTPKHIWICWLQGIEHAPEIVRQCFRSVQHFAPDYEITLLTESNLLDWCTIPDDITAKYKSGRIGFAHFADIVRTNLLVEHGGIWLDATVLLTGALPDFITSSQVFFFRSSWIAPVQHVGSNWLLASQPHNPLFENQQTLLYEYWRHERYLKDYFIYHLFTYLIMQSNAQSRTIIQNMPYRNNAAPLTMVFRMFEPYSERLYNDITTESAVHKLSYKFTEQQKAEIAKGGLLINHLFGETAK